MIHQSCTFIYFCIRAVSWEQFQGFLSFPDGFYQMSMYTTVIFLSQLSKTCDQFFTAGWSKTRCQDGFNLFASLMCSQIFFGLVQRFFCSLNKKLRRITVHVYFSNITVHSFFFHFIEEIIGCITMNGCKYICMKSTMENHLIYKSVIAVFGILHTLKTGFLRKCIMIQPVRKQTIHTDSTLYILSTMYMKIGKCRNDQLITIINYFHTIICFRDFFTNLGNHTIFYYNIAVFMNFHPVCSRCK